MYKHILHKHPPFKKMKPPYSHQINDGLFLDRIDEVEIAHHPFDLPVKGWWSNHWLSDSEKERR